MALTLNDNWVAAMSKPGAQVRYLVSITDGTNTFTAVDGICDQMTYPAAVRNVSAVSAEMDPFTRVTTLGSTFVTMDDAWVRNIIASRNVPVNLKGKKITIELGTRELAEADFAPLFVGVIESLDAGRHRSGVVIDALDLFAVIKRKKITGTWLGRNPLEIIEDIIDNHIGLPSALWDATSLDPSDTANAEISHFQIQRVSVGDGQSTFIESPTDAWAIIQELCAIVDGQMVMTEDGVLTFKLFDPTIASVSTWGTDEIIELDQIDTDDNLANKISISWMSDMESDPVTVPHPSGSSETIELVPAKALTQRYEIDDTTSQSDAALPGMSDRVVSREIATPWLDWGIAYLGADISDTDTSMTMIMRGPAAGGFCGMQEFLTELLYVADGLWDLDLAPFSAQSTHMIPSSSKPCYLRIGIEDNVEIVKVTSAYVASTDSADRTIGAIFVPGDERVPGDVSGYYGRGIVTATIERAQLGTTAKAHEGETERGQGGFLSTASTYGYTPIIDLTIPHRLATRKVERYSNAAPVVTVTVGLREYAPQLGDFVRLNWPDFLTYDYDGISSSDGKWEVVRKQIDTSGAEAVIQYDLVFGEDRGGTLVHLAPGVRPNMGLTNISALTGNISRGAIDNGLEPIAGTGLVLEVSKGRASNHVTTARINALSVNLEASKDTYLVTNPMNGTVRSISVALGADPPDTGASEVFIAKASTDATTVTAIDTSLRVSEPIRGTALVKSSVGFRQQSTVDSESFGGASILPNGDIGTFSRGAAFPPDGWEVG